MRCAAAVLLVALVTACGSGAPSVTDYAAQAESLVATMESQFAVADAQWEDSEPSVEGAAEYWQRRLEIRHEFLEGVRALELPEEVGGMHARALDIFTRITEADEALAAKVAGLDEIASHWGWVDTPEGAAADAVLEEVFAFCRESQADFDESADRKALQDVWVPAEVRRDVSVAFGCPP